MKLTEKLLQKMEQKKELYGDGIIMPDGDYRLIQDGHLKTLMSLLPYTENEIKADSVFLKEADQLRDYHTWVCIID